MYQKMHKDANFFYLFLHEVYMTVYSCHFEKILFIIFSLLLSFFMRKQPPIEPTLFSFSAVKITSYYVSEWTLTVINKMEML